MYNRKHKAWESSYPENKISWCKLPENRENPEALFILADHILSKASKGLETADAVYNMERSAKAGYALAALGMGQMFQFGWGVHPNDRIARTWYEKAKELGLKEADEWIRLLSKKRRNRVLGVAVGVAVVAAVICAVALLPGYLRRSRIKVAKDTELITPVTIEEFNQAVVELIAENDGELVVSGEQSTNRLLLLFDGDGIDLSAFPATTVIANGDNYVVIQFASEDEAKECLESLKNMENVKYVEEDEYSFSVDTVADSGDYSTTSGEVYYSSYTGYSYYSWGVEYMGMDQLAAWLYTQDTQSVTVAVIDTGVSPVSETADRILEGTDLVDEDGGNGQNDTGGHGTHVASTILDCTRGLDVDILPIRVLDENGASNSAIEMGLQYAINEGVDVINMSLGGPMVTDSSGNCDSMVDYFIQEAVDQGIVVVVSAGNGDDEGNPIDTATYCPAHNESAIVVGAIDSTGSITYFSNYGDSVDVCAPGLNVVSNYIGDTLESLSGTSMAAPHISALAAMLKTYLPDASTADIEKYITDYSLGGGDLLYYGSGCPWAAYFAGE